SPVPANDAVDVAITITDLTFNLVGHQGDPMDYSVETSPSIGSDSASGVGNNTYNVPVSGLAFDTVYTWFVNVTDGTYDSNKTFSFTTRPENYLPDVSNEMPSDDAVEIPVGTVEFSVDVGDRDAENMDVTFKTNESGSWQVIGSNNSVGNGTYRQSHVFDSTGVLYYWCVNVSDTFGGWTNETYVFTTERVWFDNDWSYRKQFIVNENSGSTLTDYQVPITVDYGSGEDNGDTVYVDGNSRSDFGDIRFTDATGLNEFDYWLEIKTDGVEALFWVEIDSLPASSDTSLYLYYGNSGATTSSNGNNTFPMFDHFLGSDINSTLWEFLENGPDLIGYDVSGSVFSIWEKTVADDDYGSLVTNPALFSQNQALRFYTNMGVESNASEGARDIGGKKAHNNAGADTNFEVIYCSYNTIPNFAAHATSGTAVNYMPFSDGWFDSWEVFEVRRDPSYCEFVHDGSGETLRETSLFYTGNEYIAIHCCNTVKKMYVDWILLRNFVDPSPSIKAWGTEQVQLYPEVIDPSPVLGDVNVSLNPRLSAYVDDHDDDLQSITFRTNASGSWADIGINITSVDSRYSQAVTSMDVYENKYYWSVNVTDDAGHWVNRTYYFTTISGKPILSNSVPINGAVNQPVNPVLSIDVVDPQGDLENVSFRTNASGSWSLIGFNASSPLANGTYSQIPSNMDTYDKMYWWSVNATDGINWANMTYYFTTTRESGGWSISCPYRKKITIDHTLISSDLINFPFLIDITDIDLRDKAQADGDDIQFSNYYGDNLSHEIEYYDDSDGHLIAWVNITYLYSNMDTVLYMYYGDPDCGNQEDVAGVWDSNYTMVQHLNETSGTHYDSTVYGNDGSPYNGVNQSGVGLIDGCDTYDATDDYVDCRYDNGLEPGTGDYTIEVWLKRLDFGTVHSILSKRAGTGDGYGFWIEAEDELRFYAIPVGGSLNMQ
ncbi:DUF2341 domain-containing protein, partial [Thermoplasmatota archaeon]